jgi:hypothetical protein
VKSKDDLAGTPEQTRAGANFRQEDSFRSIGKGGKSKKRHRAVTKWDLLRGLRCAVEDFLHVGIATADEQFRHYFDPSVLNASNLPSGAYTILRNGLLAEHIGRLLVQLREPDNIDGFNHRDPVVRRWKTLKRDFPDVPTMLSKLQPG